MRPGENTPTPFHKSFKYAAEGVAESFRQGRNIRVQTCAAVLAVILGFALRISAYEWIIIVLCIGLVIGGECFNTSFENVVDLASPDIDPKAKNAKDMAASGVMILAGASFVIGLIIFVPKLFALLGW